MTAFRGLLPRRPPPEPPRPNPPPHTIRVSCSGLYENAVFANVFWVRNGQQQTPGAPELEAFAEAFGQQYVGLFGAELVPAWNPELVTALYYGATGGVLKADANIVGQGAYVGSATPANVACCVSWHVPEPYRGGHPRTYFCGVAESVVATPRTWDTPFIDRMRDRANSFNLAVNGLALGGGGDLHLGVVSFVHNAAWRTPPVFRDFTPAAATVDHRIDTMRRRLGPDTT